MPLHRFCVHTLTTVYRTIEEAEKSATTSQSQQTTGPNQVNPLLLALNQELRQLNEAAVEQRTPEIITGNTLPVNTGGLGKLMSLSQSWLLAAALPNVFTRLQDRKAPSTLQPNTDKLDTSEASIASIAAIDAAATPSISHLMSTIPTHWSLLYDSQQHG